MTRVRFPSPAPTLARWLALVPALIAAGCITASNPLSKEQVATFKLTQVNVTFTPDSIVSWPDGEREFAKSKGVEVPLFGPNTAAATPEGQAHLRKQIGGKLHDTFRDYVGAVLTGNRPVRLNVAVQAAHISPTFGSGVSSIKADVSLVDAKTGELLLALPEQKLSTAANTGGAVGALLTEAMHGPGVDLATKLYARLYASWLTQRLQL